MRRLSIKDFHNFMRGPFAKSIERAYKSHHIFCEADLQSVAWYEISRFLRRHEEAKGKFRVLNKPFLRDCKKTFPDLVVFRKRKPWVVIELKESKRLMLASAAAERQKLAEARRVLNHKRGYLVYVARTGERRALHGPKGKNNAYHFLEVPIILSLMPDQDQGKVAAWVEKFKSWSKYVIDPQGSRSLVTTEESPSQKY
jgi:hypothetical protein